MTSGDMVRAALDGLIKDRKASAAAEIMGISNSTLRNVLKGQQTVNEDLLRQIRRFPGFSERNDKIAGISNPNADALNVGERLLRAYPGMGAGMIVFALENLAGQVGAEAVAKNLNALANLLRDHTPIPPTPKKSAKSG